MCKTGAEMRLSFCDLAWYNRIAYKVNVTSLENASVFGNNRGRAGSFGINQNFSYEYKIYVHKKDCERALRLIQ